MYQYRRNYREIPKGHSRRFTVALIKMFFLILTPTELKLEYLPIFM